MDSYEILDDLEEEEFLLQVDVYLSEPPPPRQSTPEHTQDPGTGIASANILPTVVLATATHGGLGMNGAEASGSARNHMPSPPP